MLLQSFLTHTKNKYFHYIESQRTKGSEGGENIAREY